MTTATRETNSSIEPRLVRIETRLDSMATKEDLANSYGELRTEIATRFGEQDAKIEARFGELKAEIANLRTDMIRWIFGTVAISSTIIVSVVTIVDQLID